MKLNRPAITYVELLITITLFSIVSAASVSLIGNNLRSIRKIQSQAFLYTEAAALMDMVAQATEGKTLDFEAYYDRRVHAVQSEGMLPVAMENIRWQNGANSSAYGEYGRLFFDGITELGFNSDPASPDDYDSANAVCLGHDTLSCDSFAFHVQNELIMINAAGDERSVMRLRGRDIEGEHDLVSMTLTATDSNDDAIPDLWKCRADFLDECGENETPNLSEFVRVTPENLSVKDFYVFISPLEDPNRAFLEENSRIQPQVNIVMTVTLSENYGSGVLGEVPQITLQRGISTDIYELVPSYDPEA